MDPLFQYSLILERQTIAAEVIFSVRTNATLQPRTAQKLTMLPSQVFTTVNFLQNNAHVLLAINFIYQTLRMNTPHYRCRKIDGPMDKWTLWSAHSRMDGHPVRLS